MRFTVRRERFEQLPGNLRRNAGPAIFDFRHHFGWSAPNTQNYFTAVRHGIGCVIDEIMKNPPEPLRIEQQLD